MSWPWCPPGILLHVNAKTEGKVGSIDKVKKMPGCVCSGINPSMPEKLKPAVGYPGNLESTGKHKLVACSEPWSLGLPQPCPGPTHLHFCSISRMLGPLGETWDWGQGLKSQVLESGQLQTSSFLLRVVELAQAPDREDGFLCSNWPGRESKDPPEGLLSPYHPVEWGSRRWEKTECEQEPKQTCLRNLKTTPPPKNPSRLKSHLGERWQQSTVPFSQSRSSLKTPEDSN